MGKLHADLLDQQLAAEAPVAEADIPRVREMWRKEMVKDEPNLDVKSQFAQILIKSRSHERNREGMALLQGLADCGYHVEECYYNLALGLYRMGRYQESREMVELVLRMDPDLPQAQTLHKAVQEAAARRNQNLMTAAAGGAAIAGVGVLLGSILLRR